MYVYTCLPCFSPGTFKRTFFFAAPSDALMLQWANVLEKVKNAQDGECGDGHVISCYGHQMIARLLMIHWLVQQLQLQTLSSLQ